MMVFSPATKMYIKAIMLENYDMSERSCVAILKQHNMHLNWKRPQIMQPISMTKHYLHNYIETTQKVKRATMSLNVEFFSSYDTFPLQHNIVFIQ